MTNKSLTDLLPEQLNLDTPEELAIPKDIQKIIVEEELQTWKNTRWRAFLRLRSATTSGMQDTQVLKNDFEFTERQVAIHEALLKALAGS